jgi:acetyltransferase-like isoleucine patch superfamily enzyme
MINIILRSLLKLYVLLKIRYIKSTSDGSEFGPGFRIDLKTKIVCKKGRLVVGNNVYLRSNPSGYHAGMPFPSTILLDAKNATCKIGSNSRINGAYIHAKKEVVIGKNCVIASGVNIIDSDGHVLYSGDRTTGVDEPKPITIGDNVWIGLNAIILKGSIIGKNSVVSAGSVVKGEFPENSLIQGNPGAHIKELRIDVSELNSGVK